MDAGTQSNCWHHADLMRIARMHHAGTSAFSVTVVFAKPPSDDELRISFQALLNRALTHGRARAAPRGYGLGPDTVAAIEAIAYDHPDAEAECIAAADNAFAREHGAEAPDE